MNPTPNYANTQASTGEYEKLPVGGHICQIRGARCENSKSGKEMLVLAIEIHENSQYDGYYKRSYDRIKGYNADAKWPGVYYQVTTDKDGNTSPMFKGLITAIEESNPDYKWNWNEISLQGKLVGFNFGEEEYIQQSTGEVKTNVKPMFPASVARVREGLIPPAIKKANNAAKPQQGGFSSPQQIGFSQLPDDDKLPF